MVLQFLHHGLETVGYQQLGRVGREGSDGNDVQVFGHMLDRIEDMLGLAVQVCGNAMVVALQRLAQGCLAQVKVQQEDAGALDGHTGSHVHNGKGLTGIRRKGGDHDHVAPFFLADHQIQVRTEDTESLVHHIALAALDDNRAIGIIETVGPQTLPVTAIQTHLRDFREERELQIHQIGTGLHRGIQHLPQEEVNQR